MRDLLREWGQRRRLSQLDFACEAEISTRHLRFLARCGRHVGVSACLDFSVPIAPVWRFGPRAGAGLNRQTCRC